MKRILMAMAVIALMLAPMAYAQTTQPIVTYTWTAPTTGTLATSYVVELKTGPTGNWVPYGTVTSNTVTFTNLFEYGVEYQVRVAGVDDSSRQGPFSNPSDPYTPDLGAPGVPGKPIILGL